MIHLHKHTVTSVFFVEKSAAILSKQLAIMWVEIEGNEARLSGSIWSGDGGFVASDLHSFLTHAGPVVIHINTPGGSVFDGFVIYNTIKNSGADVTMNINGLCASMGTIIMLAGKRVTMADNAFLMTHAPRVDTYGTADELEKQGKLLRSIEDIFAKYFVAKTGKTDAEARLLMNGENWFSAPEALAEGLIDEVTPSAESLVDMSALFGSNIAAVMDAYERVDPKHKKETIKIENRMKLTAQSNQFLGLADGATENDINAAIEKLNARASKAESDLNEDRKKGITALVDDAVAAGKITAAQKDQFVKLAENDLTIAKDTLAMLQPKTNLSAGLNIQGKESNTLVNADWSFSDYSKKDPAALADIRVNNPEAYAKLLKTRNN